jgi:hypothetical protein
MKYIRVIDKVGNKTDYEAENVPRIGELVMMEYGIGGETVRPHYFRVKDVLYNLGNAPENQAAILVQEETEMDWLS